MTLLILFFAMITLTAWATYRIYQRKTITPINKDMKMHLKRIGLLMIFLSVTGCSLEFGFSNRGQEDKESTYKITLR